MKDDPAIEMVRAARHKISARFGHDLKKLGEYYMKRQQRHKGRLLGGRKDVSS